LFDDTRETLMALRRRGFIVSVISNFDSRLFGILEGLGIAPQLDSVLISSQVGFAKPDAGIFRAALTHHNVQPAEVLFVGDTPDADVMGAKGAGIRGILLDPQARQQGDFLRIQNLKEVLTLIDSNS
ncbi:MAG: HAD-IA family hydrolase, partial [Deltaproteobacteria bacterium]|nr:HAD-IA family hydrolase [Deltaproteobacteria bacterium]